MLPSPAIRGKINDGSKNHNGRPCGYIHIIGNHKPKHTGKHRKQNGKEMVFPHISRNILGGSRWENQKRIDNQNPYPLNGHHNNQRCQHSKEIFHPCRRNMAASRQSPIQAHCQKLVKAKHPKYKRNCKNKNKIYDFLWRDA